MKIYVRTLIILTICFYSTEIFAQETKISNYYYAVNNGDTVLVIDMDPVSITNRPKNPRFYRNASRLTKAIAIAYPIAKEAELRVDQMREKIETINDQYEKRKYIAQMEKELEDIYTPVLRKMTFYQGAVLLKLIDRQTGDSGYILLKSIKNGFTAFFWHAIAKMYGANLKMKYDPEDADKIMEIFVLKHISLLENNNISIYPKMTPQPIANQQEL